MVNNNSLKTDYLSLLEQGVDAWNEWRSHYPEVKPDLSQLYLFEINLSGANLRHSILNRTCLIGANLRGADLQGADLDGAYVSNADLTEASLQNANLSWANFSHANLTNANLSFTRSDGTNFSSACLTGACLEGWSITLSTQLSQIEGSYIYLQQPNQKCRPQGRSFEEGELKQLLLLQAGLPASDAAPEAPSDVFPASLLPLLSLEGATTSGNSQSQPLTQVPPTALKLSSIATTPAQTAPLPTKMPISGSQPLLSTELPRLWLTIAGWGAAIALGWGMAKVPWRSPLPFQTVAPTIPDLSALPCNEPPLPPLPANRTDYHQYINGTQYYGKLKNGTPANGRGVMIYASGNRYDGDYRDGKRNGCGTFTFAQGRSYSGQFHNDLFDGQGILTLENGDRYIGEFRNNRCHGRGTLVLTNGTTRSGQWQNGDLIGSSYSCN